MIRREFIKSALVGATAAARIPTSAPMWSGHDRRGLRLTVDQQHAIWFYRSGVSAVRPWTNERPVKRRKGQPPNTSRVRVMTGESSMLLPFKW